MKKRLNLVATMAVIGLSALLTGCSDDDDSAPSGGGPAAASAPTVATFNTSTTTASVTEGNTTRAFTFKSVAAGKTFQINSADAGTYEYRDPSGSTARLILTYTAGTAAGTVEDLTLTFSDAHTGSFNGTRTPSGAAAQNISGNFSGLDAVPDQGEQQQTQDHAPQSLAQGAELDVIGEHVILYRNGQIKEGETVSGTWTYLKTGTNAATVTITRGGVQDAVALTFSSANAGSYSSTGETGSGSFSNLVLLAPQSPDQQQTGFARTTVGGTRFTFTATGGGGQDRQFTTTAAGPPENGTFTDPGDFSATSANGTYTYSKLTDTTADLALIYSATSGTLSGFTDTYNLTYSSATAGSYNVVGVGPGTFVVTTP